MKWARGAILGLICILAFGLAALVSNCAGDGDDDDDDDTVECPSVIDQLQGLLEDAEASLTLVGEGSCEQVSQDNIDELAKKVADEMVFFEDSEPVKVKDSDVPQGDRDEFANNLVDEGLIASGYFTLELNWETEDGDEFSTLAIVTEDDELKFEPVSFFDIFTELSAEDPEEGAKGTQGFTHEGGWENIFGMEITWNLAVSVQTSPDRCNIVDPAPHATVSCTSIPLCEVKCKVKETPYCSPNEMCDCRILGPVQAYHEDAIKVELNVAFACGFKSVEVEADGFSLKIEGYLGSNGIQSHAYNLGASSGLISWQ